MRPFSLVCGDDYLGLLSLSEFPPMFDARETITGAQIDLGSRAWEAFCAEDPRGLVPLASARSRGPAVTSPRAIRRHLEEFPSTVNGLARSERRSCSVLSEGDAHARRDLFVERCAHSKSGSSWAT